MGDVEKGPPDHNATLDVFYLAHNFVYSDGMRQNIQFNTVPTEAYDNNVKLLFER